MPVQALNASKHFKKSLLIDYVCDILSVEISAYKRLRRAGKFQNLKAIGTVPRLGLNK